jgi:hypothetical protein
MSIWVGQGRITVELEELAIELAFDKREDGSTLAAWLNSRSGIVIGFVPVGVA